MDSLTQIALGAAVGEAVAGKKAGNKAVLWGAVLGTVPDLDVVSALFLNPVDYIFFHRGFSHSIVFFILSAPVFGWLLRHINRKETATWKDWTLLSFWVLFTHALLDCFTSWGTQLFWPLDYRVAFNSIFIVDPLYTLPLLVTVIWMMYYKRDSSFRRQLNYAGLILSTCYLTGTLVNKQVINKHFEKALETQQIHYQRYSTKNTPFQNILWYATVEVDSGFYIGYYSHFDCNADITFEFVPNNHQLIEKYKEEPELRKLLKLMNGYYAVELQGDTLLLHDLRFGRLTDFRDGGMREFVFSYFVIPLQDGVLIEPKPRDPSKYSGEMIGMLFKRVFNLL